MRMSCCWFFWRCRFELNGRKIKVEKGRRDDNGPDRRGPAKGPRETGQNRVCVRIWRLPACRLSGGPLCVPSSAPCWAWRVWTWDLMSCRVPLLMPGAWARLLGVECGGGVEYTRMCVRVQRASFDAWSLGSSSLTWSVRECVRVAAPDTWGSRNEGRGGRGGRAVRTSVLQQDLHGRLMLDPPTKTLSTKHVRAREPCVS